MSKAAKPVGHPNWRKVALFAAVVVAAMLALTARHDAPNLNIDQGAFKVPTPPVDAAYSGSHTAISIAWLGIVALIGFGLAFRTGAVPATRSRSLSRAARR